MDFILWQSIHEIFFFVVAEEAYFDLCLASITSCTCIRFSNGDSRLYKRSARDIKDRHGDRCRVTPPCLVMGPRY
jgi:hypothetical protein